MTSIYAVSDSMRKLLPPTCPSRIIDDTLILFKTYFDSYYELVEIWPGLFPTLGPVGNGFEHGWSREGASVLSRTNSNGIELTVSNGRIGSWLDDYFQPTAPINGLSKTLRFKAWIERDTKKICETLSVKGSNELVEQCYENPFEARLLLPICQDSYRPTLGQAGQALGYLSGAAATIKVVQNLYAGNYRRAIVWSGIAITGFILPNYLKA